MHTGTGCSEGRRLREGQRRRVRLTLPQQPAVVQGVSAVHTVRHCGLSWPVPWSPGLAHMKPVVLFCMARPALTMLSACGQLRRAKTYCQLTWA